MSNASNQQTELQKVQYEIEKIIKEIDSVNIKINAIKQDLATYKSSLLNSSPQDSPMYIALGYCATAELTILGERFLF